MNHGCRDEVKTHFLESEYQNGRQEVRVLLPDKYDGKKKHKVLYVLPVEAGFNRVYGYGLGVLQEMNAHNGYDLIMVQMGFEKEPWFGDHAVNPGIRQASYLKKAVVPFIETNYSAFGSPEGRLLFGFSKSGWGAFSLILTYPDFFGYAAAWDAPLLLEGFHFGMQAVYGTMEQLIRYHPGLLVTRQQMAFQDKTRLVLTGEKDWGKGIPTPSGGSHTVEMHELLEHNMIKHYYDNRLSAPHCWHKSWMVPTLKALMNLTK
ncbi:MAG: hypothetical protein KJ964_02060 [Verrucomicrobia bacterium]|nr:hypothetical protein [Verrucomicrobiota bacterium]